MRLDSDVTDPAISLAGAPACRLLPTGQADRDDGARRGRHPASRPRLRQLPDQLRLAPTAAGGAGGLRDLGAAAGELRRSALGLLGAQPRPRPVQGPLAVGRGPGQDRADHRRLVGDRQSDARSRSPTPARRCCSSPARSRSSRRPRRRSRMRAASPTSTAATCPTSRTSSGWPTEVLAYHGHVDILVNNAGRSIRRSVALSYDRFHDYERTMQLNYFGAVRLILALLPAMRAAQVGPHHQHQLDRHADQPAAVLGLRRLEGGARRLQPRDRLRGGRRRRPHHDDPHAAGADADDRADPDVRRLPGDHARGGGGDDHQGDDRASRRRWRPGSATSASCSTRSRPTLSDTILNTAYKLFPESQAAKGKGEEAPDKAPSTEAVAFAHLMKGVHW